MKAQLLSPRELFKNEIRERESEAKRGKRERDRGEDGHVQGPHAVDLGSHHTWVCEHALRARWMLGKICFQVTLWSWPVGSAGALPAVWLLWVLCGELGCLGEPQNRAGLCLPSVHAADGWPLHPLQLLPGSLLPHTIPAPPG